MDLFEYAEKMKGDAERAKAEDPAIFTVSEITSEIKALLTSRFGSERVWVKGEVSNYKGRNQSGHMYFRLKDAGAVINCVFFRGSNAKLKVDLKEGMEVLASGRLDLWDKGGNYQLILDEVRSGGVGELHLRFEALKKKLESEGLFAAERKRALPSFPAKIGLVTSSTGAVVRDIIHVIRGRCPGVEVLLFPVKVQGDGSAREIAQAIEALNDPTLGLDVLIVGRGGGSIEDLWAFNEEEVARAIFSSRLPVVSAVGHQTDFTIADFVADARAATPSHAAEITVPNQMELNQKVRMWMRAILQDLIHYRDLSSERLERLRSSQGLQDPKHRIQARTQEVDHLTQRLITALEEKRSDRKERFARAELLLGRLPARFLFPRKSRFERAASNLSILNPLSILSRGYSVVKSKAGRVVKSAGDVSVGDSIRVTLFEGEIACDVTKTSKD